MSFLGGGGSQSTNTVQNTAQTYNANPQIAAAGTQALQQAQTAASQPFQMPQAPVAGFGADTMGAFQGIRNAQGMAQPYFNQAANYFSPQGAQSFLNPYTANVMAGMKDVFGQQQSQNEGNLVQSAGGVGADRIGVGQANLAHQQDLAAGQTLAGMYSQAVQQAQNAGQGTAALGMQSQNAALQGAQAQLQAGNLQQHQTQQVLNAPYQQQLAQIAYPYQNAQYLAGITGSLAPAFGGTTIGNQNGQTTAPQPSMLSQILGIGTAGAGLYGAFGGFGGSPSYGGGSAFSGDAYGGSGSNPLPGLSPSDYGAGYAEGGEVGEEDNQRIPGITSNEGLSPIPYLPLHGGAGHSSPLTGGVTFQQPQQEKPQDSGGGLGGVLKAAASIAPFFALKDGGVAGYDEGGDTEEHFNPGKILRDAYEGNYGPKAWNAITGAFSSPAAATPTASPGFADRFAGMGPPPAAPTIADAGNNRQAGTDKLIQGMTTPYRLNAPGVRPSGNPNNMPKGASAGDEEAAPAVSIPANRETAPNQVLRGMMPQAAQPYPDALERNPGQVATRSPWMALVNAGATMAATPGPLGVSLGKGMLAGTKSLDDQRKELQSEQGINQKAQALYQTAKAELDKYNKMTPYEAASVQARNREIDQSGATGDTSKLYMRARQLAATEVNRELANNPSIAIGKTPAQIDAIIAARASAIMQRSGAGVAAGAPVPGSTGDTALPDPGESRRVKGMWYIGPTGKPQQWQ